MAEEDIKKALQKVKVSSKGAMLVEDKINKLISDSWKEKCEAMLTKGVPMEKIDGYLEHLKDSYDGIDENTLKKLKAVKYGNEFHNKIFDFAVSVKEVSKCSYGMLGFKKHGNEVDFMYCVYNISYDIPERVLKEETRKVSWFWGLLSYDAIVKREVSNQLSIQDVNELKNFFRYKALHGFYQEGLIDSICDVPLDQIPNDNGECKSLK